MGLPKTLAWQNPVYINFAAATNAAVLTAGDCTLFIADTDYELVSVSEVHETLGTDGGAVSFDIKKCTGTQAASAGVTMLAAVFNAKATINTVVTKNKSNAGLTATAANRLVSSGNRIALDMIGVMTAVTGVCIQLILRRLRRPTF